MKKIDLGQSLGIAANIGVILGIVFLAIEIRQAGQAIAGSAYQARALAMMARQDMVADSDNLGDALFMSARGETLDERERGRIYSSYLGAYFRIDGLFYQYELGLLPDDYYENVFDAEMRLWLPRWIEFGVMETVCTNGFIRPTFHAEILKYTDSGEDPCALYVQ